MKQYTVTGMSCAACQARVEKAVSGVEGVTSCAVSLLTNSMGVEGTASDKDIIAAVEKAGYGAMPKGASRSSETANEDPLKDTETPVLKRRLVLSAGFLIVLMYFSMGHNMWNFPIPSWFTGNTPAMAIVQMILAAIVMIINHKFFKNGFGTLVHGAPNMDTLVAMGSMTSFVWSVIVLFMMTDAVVKGDMEKAHSLYHGQLYFESAAMIPTLITIGKMLEAKSKGETTNALKGLMKLSPKTAKLIRDGKETVVPIEEVQIGDLFAVYSGDAVSADGVVVEGSAAVNESALTGESIPADKTAGDKVSAATISESGYMVCRATRVGKDTTISQIIQMVEESAATKAPIARKADKISAVFVPAVIGIALVTILGWLIAGKDLGFALARGISVLVISCPCALGLATPVAIMVGNGVGAKNGVLFKTSEALETLGEAQIIALDKTGTVTSGKPKVTDIVALEGTEEDLIRLAYTLEKRSEHPLARAVIEEGDKRGIRALDAEDFRVVPGNGLSVRQGEDQLYGGNAKFIRTKIRMPQDAINAAERFAEQGKTPLFFAKNDRLAGIIAVMDVLKEDAKDAVSSLKKLGLKVVMLTGDNEKTARAIGNEAGADTVIAGVLPDEKEQVIAELQKYGKTVMVGDGINDSPALTKADNGIAIGAGTDVAIDAADIVLVNSRLEDVPCAVRLSRAVLRNIYQNLFWAFFYNLVCIPLAAGLFKVQMSPMIGAAAMSLSSVTVVTNALRLNGFNMKNKAKDKPRKNSIPGELPVIWESRKEKENMTKTIKIEGMMCPHCEATVVKALKKIDGVADAKASHTAGEAVVTLEKDVDNELLKQAVEDRDYTVTGIE
ncbi:MAG: heavy metal translocating P-type ATPase [Erysipelotrichales bacterium]|nr:heavy metal translocating P-type ATPase [Erysipelotrichales bacterium]